MLKGGQAILINYDKVKLSTLDLTGKILLQENGFCCTQPNLFLELFSCLLFRVSLCYNSGTFPLIVFHVSFGRDLLTLLPSD